MRPTLAALALVVLAGNLARGDDKPLEGDLKKIQGKWTTNAGPASAPVYFTFDKNVVNFTVVGPMGEEATISGEFTLDESGSPRQIDMINMKNGKNPLPKILAIYAFDGDDKLKIAGSPEGKSRPKEMIEKTAADNKGNTLVFTRVKGDKK